MILLQIGYSIQMEILYHGFQFYGTVERLVLLGYKENLRSLKLIHIRWGGVVPVQPQRAQGHFN
jgi:hypothetical protein